MANTQAKRYPK